MKQRQSVVKKEKELARWRKKQRKAERRQQKRERKKENLNAELSHLSQPPS
jgi:hypothetical protein